MRNGILWGVVLLAGACLSASGASSIAVNVRWHNDGNSSAWGAVAPVGGSCGGIVGVGAHTTSSYSQYSSQTVGQTFTVYWLGAASCGNVSQTIPYQVADNSGGFMTIEVYLVGTTNNTPGSLPPVYTANACVTNNTPYAQWVQLTYQATDSSGLYSNNSWYQVQPYSIFCLPIASGHPFIWSFQAADCKGCAGAGPTLSSGSGGANGGGTIGTDPCLGCNPTGAPVDGTNTPPNNIVTNIVGQPITSDTNTVIAIYRANDALISALANYNAQLHGDLVQNGQKESSIATSTAAGAASEASVAASTASTATSVAAIAGNTAAIAVNTQVATNQLGAIQANTLATASNAVVEVGALYSITNLLGAGGALFQVLSNGNSDFHTNLTQLTNELGQSIASAITNAASIVQSVTNSAGQAVSQSVSNTLIISNVLSSIQSTLAGGLNVNVGTNEGDLGATNTVALTNGFDASIGMTNVAGASNGLVALAPFPDRSQMGSVAPVFTIPLSKFTDAGHSWTMADVSVDLADHSFDLGVDATTGLTVTLVHLFRGFVLVLVTAGFLLSSFRVLGKVGGL